MTGPAFNTWLRDKKGKTLCETHCIWQRVPDFLTTDKKRTVTGRSSTSSGTIQSPCLSGAETAQSKDRRVQRGSQELGRSGRKTPVVRFATLDPALNWQTGQMVQEKRDVIKPWRFHDESSASMKNASKPLEGQFLDTKMTLDTIIEPREKTRESELHRKKVIDVRNTDHRRLRAAKHEDIIEMFCSTVRWESMTKPRYLMKEEGTIDALHTRNGVN